VPRGRLPKADAAGVVEERGVPCVDAPVEHERLGAEQRPRGGIVGQQLRREDGQVPGRRALGRIGQAVRVGEARLAQPPSAFRARSSSPRTSPRRRPAARPARWRRRWRTRWPRPPAVRAGAPGDQAEPHPVARRAGRVDADGDELVGIDLMMGLDRSHGRDNVISFTRLAGARSTRAFLA
jgi:hypothetical protein